MDGSGQTDMVSAEPTAIEIAWARTALLVFDMQRDFLEPGEIVIDKPGKDVFYATALDDVLKQRDIDTLLVCDVATEVCVNTTVREANDRGYRCVVLGDCCASYFQEFHDAGLAMIKAQGSIFGWVSHSRAVLDALA